LKLSHTWLKTSYISGVKVRLKVIKDLFITDKYYYGSARSFGYYHDNPNYLSVLKHSIKMLNYGFLKIYVINFLKNGYYWDYLLRSASRKIIYRYLISLAFFFAEKYLIEYNTKFIFNYITYILTKNIIKMHSRRLSFLVILAFLNINLLLL
jgi:hypothetical protein